MFVGITTFICDLRKNLVLIKHFELFQSMKYQFVFALSLVLVVRK